MNKALVFLFVVLSLKLTHQKLEETFCADVEDPSGYADCKGKPVPNSSGKCCFLKAKSQNKSVNKCAPIVSETAGDMLKFLRDPENIDFSGVDCGNGLFEIDRNATYCSDTTNNEPNSFDEELCYKTKRFYKYSKCYLATKKTSENSSPDKACVEASTKDEAKEWVDKEYNITYDISLFESFCGEQLDPASQADCETSKFREPSKTKCCMANYFVDRSTSTRDNKCHAFENENAYFVLKELREHYQVNESPQIDYFDCGHGKVNINSGVKRKYCTDYEADDDSVTKDTCSNVLVKLYDNTKCCYAKVVESNASIKSARCVEAKDETEVKDFLKKLYGQTNLNTTVVCGSSYVYLGYLSLLLLALF